MDVRTIAVAVAVAVMLSGCRRNAADELNAITRALEYRPIEGRLSGSSYATRPPARSASEVVVFKKLHMRKALELTIAQQSDELRARALLLMGQPGAAKNLLQKVTSLRDAPATAWNDYAAVLHATSAADDLLQLSMALAAADRALDLQPALPEASFNRAIILDALALRGAAAVACRKYLELDSSSEWASEIRDRLVRIESTQSRIAAYRDLGNDLDRAAVAGDELFINDVATTYPEDARSWSDFYLAQWGARVLERDHAAASSTLLLCRVIGRALETNRGDSLLADTVRAIEAGAGSREQLARAHIAYERGRRAMKWHESARALRTLEEARRAFSENGSPMALRASLYMAIARREKNSAALTQAFEQGRKRFGEHGRPGVLSAPLSKAIAEDERVSATILNDLAKIAPSRYRELHAQVQRQLASLAARRGSPADALQSLRSAIATFEALGEKQSAVVTRSVTTDLMAASGNTNAAWRMRHAVMTCAAEAGNDLRLMREVSKAAEEAISDGRWDIAYSLLNIVAGESRRHDWFRSDAIVWSAYAASRARMPRAAATALAEARATKRTTDDLRLVEALLAEDKETTISLLTQSLRTAENGTATAQLLLARARAFSEMREPRRAQEDLERVVKLLESVRVITASTKIRDAIVGSPRETFHMLADALDRDGDAGRAQEMLERFRTWPRGARNPPSPIDWQAFPPSTVIVSYGLFHDRVVIYANNIRATVSVPSAEVERLANEFEHSIEQNDINRFKVVGRRLSRVLFDPIATIAQSGDTLVFVSDPALGRLPFGALIRADGRNLIEEHPIVITPSRTAWLQSLQRKRPTSRALLSIGNPLPDEQTVSLAGAEAEAKEIASMYPSRALLIGASATKQRVISNLAYCDAAHFAVHANAGLGETMQPHLILSEMNDDDGRLTAAEIAGLELDHVRTVVLAGCRTAAGKRSLVEAFLTAGAGSVVGTLWEVDDAFTRQMSVTLHRSLRDGSTPVAALRATQINMIRRAASPRVWASFQLYGSGS